MMAPVTSLGDAPHRLDRLRRPAPRRPGWRDPRLWIGVALVAISVVAGSRLLAAADDSVTVWAAAADLAAGDELTADDLEARRVRFVDEADLDRYVAADQALPADSRLLRGVGEGELLPRAALGSADESGVLQLPIAVEPALVPDSVRAGSVVSVYVRDTARCEECAGAALEGVTVVDAPPADDLTGSPPAGAGRRAVGRRPLVRAARRARAARRDRRRELSAVVVVLVLAAGAAWESAALTRLADRADVVVLKRCVDVARPARHRGRRPGRRGRGGHRRARPRPGRRRPPARPRRPSGGGAARRRRPRRRRRCARPGSGSGRWSATTSSTPWPTWSPRGRSPTTPSPATSPTRRRRPGARAAWWPSGGRPARPAAPRWRSGSPRSWPATAAPSWWTPTRGAARSPSSSASSTRSPGCSRPPGWSRPASCRSGSAGCSARSTTGSASSPGCRGPTAGWRSAPGSSTTCSTWPAATVTSWSTPASASSTTRPPTAVGRAATR